jgi:hypothetical protein
MRIPISHTTCPTYIYMPLISGLCIAKHESDLNTAAIGTLNANGSKDHGIFQVSKCINLQIYSWIYAFWFEKKKPSGSKVFLRKVIILPIFNLPWSVKIHYRVHKRQPLASNGSDINLFHNLTLYLSNIPSMLFVSQFSSFLFLFSDKR